MATYAQEKAKRREALREVRRQERELDTRIERLERLLFRLLDRKTIITQSEVKDKMATQINNITFQVEQLMKAAADFYMILSD